MAEGITPTGEGYVLSARMIAEVRALIQEALARRVNTTGRAGDQLVDHQESLAPEVYIAKVPVGGIPALIRACPDDPSSCSTGEFDIPDLPGYTDCVLYRLLREEEEDYLIGPGLIQVNTRQKRVYNIFDEDIPEHSWIIALRNKAGEFFAMPVIGSTGSATVGCHLGYDGDTLVVMTDTLAGQGLEAGTGSCDNLRVRAGCGLGFAENDELMISLTDVVQDGLYWDEENCFLGVNYGCGLTLIGDELQVDVEALAGDREISGLTVGSGSGSCVSLGVDLEEYIPLRTIEQIRSFDGLRLDGAILYGDFTEYTFYNRRNRAGLLIDRTLEFEWTGEYEVVLCCGSGTGTGTGTGTGDSYAYYCLASYGETGTGEPEYTCFYGTEEEVSDLIGGDGGFELLSGPHELEDDCDCEPPEVLTVTIEPDGQTITVQYTMDVQPGSPNNQFTLTSNSTGVTPQYTFDIDPRTKQFTVAPGVTYQEAICQVVTAQFLFNHVVGLVNGIPMIAQNTSVINNSAVPCDDPPGSGSGSGSDTGSGSDSGSGTFIETDCCPDNPVPETLNWNITNITGSCGCIDPLSGTVVYNPLTEAWEQIEFDCPVLECEENAAHSLTCVGGQWFFNGSVVSSSCDPFEVVFDVSIDPGTPGTYRITFTAP
jgi:hypothetical protein